MFSMVLVGSGSISFDTDPDSGSSHFFIRIRIQGNDTDSTDPDPPNCLRIRVEGKIKLVNKRKRYRYPVPPTKSWIPALSRQEKKTGGLMVAGVLLFLKESMAMRGRSSLLLPRWWRGWANLTPSAVRKLTCCRSESSSRFTRSLYSCRRLYSTWMIAA